MKNLIYDTETTKFVIMNDKTYFVFMGVFIFHNAKVGQ